MQIRMLNEEAATRIQLAYRRYAAYKTLLQMKVSEVTKIDESLREMDNDFVDSSLFTFSQLIAGLKMMMEQKVIENIEDTKILLEEREKDAQSLLSRLRAYVNESSTYVPYAYNQQQSPILQGEHSNLIHTALVGRGVNVPQSPGPCNSTSSDAGWEREWAGVDSSTPYYAQQTGSNRAVLPVSNSFLWGAIASSVPQTDMSASAESPGVIRGQPWDDDLHNDALSEEESSCRGGGSTALPTFQVNPSGEQDLPESVGSVRTPTRGGDGSCTAPPTAVRTRLPVSPPRLGPALLVDACGSSTCPTPMPATPQPTPGRRGSFTVTSSPSAVAARLVGCPRGRRGSVDPLGSSRVYEGRWTDLMVEGKLTRELLRTLPDEELAQIKAEFELLVLIKSRELRCEEVEHAELLDDYEALNLGVAQTVKNLSHKAAEQQQQHNQTGGGVLSSFFSSFIS